MFITVITWLVVSSVSFVVMSLAARPIQHHFLPSRTFTVADRFRRLGFGVVESEKIGARAYMCGWVYVIRQTFFDMCWCEFCKGDIYSFSQVAQIGRSGMLVRRVWIGNFCGDCGYICKVSPSLELPLAMEVGVGGNLFDLLKALEDRQMSDLEKNQRSDDILNGLLLKPKEISAVAGIG